MSRDCYVAIPLSAMGLSAVCDFDTHLLFLGVIHANSDGFGESAHSGIQVGPTFPIFPTFPYFFDLLLLFPTFS